MTSFTDKEIAEILKAINEKKPQGFSLNEIHDLELDDKYFQACSVNSGVINILYLIIPNDKVSNHHEVIVGRLCKKYKYTYGHFVKCSKNIGNQLWAIDFSKEITPLK